MRGLLERISPLPLILAGAAVVGLSLLADPLTDLIGISNEPGFGWKQIIVLGAGLALITAGVALAAREE
jgi:hypothetical protein